MAATPEFSQRGEQMHRYALTRNLPFRILDSGTDRSFCLAAGRNGYRQWDGAGSDRSSDSFGHGHVDQ